MSGQVRRSTSVIRRIGVRCYELAKSIGSMSTNKGEYGYRRSKWLGSRTNIRSFGIKNHVKEDNCPKCGRLAPMTTDYYGDVMCGTCLRNSIV